MPSHIEKIKAACERLGVSSSVTKKGLEKAYRKLAKQCHPDIFPEDPDKTREFQDLDEAYKFLLSELKDLPKIRRHERNAELYGEEVIKLEDFLKIYRDSVEKGQKGYYHEEYGKHFHAKSYVALKSDLVSAFQDAVEDFLNPEKEPLGEYNISVKTKRTLFRRVTKNSVKNYQSEQNADKISQHTLHFLDLWKIHCALKLTTGEGLEGEMPQEKIVQALQNIKKNATVMLSRKECEFQESMGWGMGYVCKRWKQSLGIIPIMFPKKMLPQPTIG